MSLKEFGSTTGMHWHRGNSFLRNEKQINELLPFLDFPIGISEHDYHLSTNFIPISVI